MARRRSPFIPGSLDDAGLTPAQFRVLCHVSRRGECCSTTETIAKTCRLHRGSVRRSLRYLAKDGWITTENRKGRTSVHRPGPKQNMAGGAETIQVGGGTRSGRGPEQNKADKGTPSKGTPSVGVPAQAGSDHLNGLSVTSAEEIYEAYPKKVGKSDALKAIGKAMKKVSSGRLLELTKQYAMARTGEDPTFTPYPSTWFNKERFNDDPVTWRNVDYSRNGGAPESQRQLSDPNGF